MTFSTTLAKTLPREVIVSYLQFETRNKIEVTFPPLPRPDMFYKFFREKCWWDEKQLRLSSKAEERHE